MDTPPFLRMARRSCDSLGRPLDTFRMLLGGLEKVLGESWGGLWKLLGGIWGGLGRVLGTFWGFLRRLGRAQGRLGPP